MLWLPFLVLGLAALATAWRPEWISRRWLWPVFGLASLFALGAHRLTAPWVSHHDFNRALFSVAARSNLRFGWLVTGGADVWNGGAAIPVELYRYLNHPPLIAWVLTLPMSVLGAHEWVARLTVFVPVLAGLVALCLRWRPAAEAGPFFWLFAAAMPAFSFYGRMPGHEPLTIALLLLFLVAAYGGQFRPLFDQFLRRSSGVVADSGEVIPSGWAWLAQVLRHGNSVVGWPVAALALAGGVFSARGELRRPVAWLAGGGLLQSLTAPTDIVVFAG